MRVLDLASGTGEPAISVAGLVGGDGHVSALDLSADLLEIAARRAEQRGLRNISFHQADAQQLPFPDDDFDLATCRFGVMFFSDVVRALSELRRVLRPQARACFAAWGPFEQPYWQSTFGVVLKRVGGPALAPGGQDPFRFAHPECLAAALTKAGFARSEAAIHKVPWNWPGEVPELWDYAQAVSAPFRPLLERVPEDQWPAINAEVHSALRRYAMTDGVKFEAQIVLASGEKS
jgi:SAM-dependent methyltransferase